MPLPHMQQAGNLPSEKPDAGIYADIDSLVALAGRAKGFAFLPRQPAHSILAGRHASNLRGRGLDFEELRAYVAGDDVRAIDWHVTARMRKPYLRVYTEERDRPALLVVDQRQAMFFGSRLNMKSVTAAEAASLAAWRIIAAGDRVGAVVFNDREIQEFRPRRSRNAVLRILHAIEQQNRALRADSTAVPNAAMLNRVLRSAANITTQNHLVIVISDFDGADGETEHLLARFAGHNDVIAALVYDPFNKEMPPPRDVVITDGNLQVEVPMTDRKVRRRIVEVAGERAARVLGWKTKLGIPALPISSGEDTLDQLRHFLGQKQSGHATA